MMIRLTSAVLKIRTHIGPRLLLGAAACLFVMAGCARNHVTVVDDAALKSTDSDPQNWITYGGNYSEQRFSRLQEINENNAGNLGLAWSYDLETLRGLEATPLVANGVMYTTSAWSIVYAFDARTGKLLWQYDPQVPKDHAKFVCCDVVNRGVAFYLGRVYFGRSTDRERPRNYRERGLRICGARIHFRLRRRHRKAGLENVHRSRRSLAGIRIGRDEAGGLDLVRRMVEDGRGRLGLGHDSVRSGDRLYFLRHGKRLALVRPAAQQRRQPLYRFDRRGARGYRRAGVGLSDDAGR